MTRRELEDYLFDLHLFGAALAPRLRALGFRSAVDDTSRGRTRARVRRDLPPASHLGHMGALIPSDPRVRAAQERAHERGLIVRVGVGRITSAR